MAGRRASAGIAAAVGFVFTAARSIAAKNVEVVPSVTMDVSVATASNAVGAPSAFTGRRRRIAGSAGAHRYASTVGARVIVKNAEGVQSACTRSLKAAVETVAAAKYVLTARLKVRAKPAVGARSASTPENEAIAGIARAAKYART